MALITTIYLENLRVHYKPFLITIILVFTPFSCFAKIFMFCYNFLYGLHLFSWYVFCYLFLFQKPLLIIEGIFIKYERIIGCSQICNQGQLQKCSQICNQGQNTLKQHFSLAATGCVLFGAEPYSPSLVPMMIHCAWILIFGRPNIMQNI